MERKKEVIRAIGESNFELLLGETRNGLITGDQFKIIALEMHKNVHGVYVDQIGRGQQPHIVLLHMLDKI